MPRLVHLTCCWLSALFLAAIAHASTSPSSVAALVVLLRVVAVMTVVAVVPAVRYRCPTHIVTLLAVSLAGLLIGDASARTTQRCHTALARHGTFIVALDARASPGRTVFGRAFGEGALARCAVPVALRVQDGNAPPGAMVRVAGNARRGPTSLRLDGALTPTGRTQAWRAWRGRMGERIDTLFGANAALVRALLIADQRGIDASVRDRFANAGLVHMLSISGLHVAIIASALLTLAGALRASRTQARVATIVVVATYVVLLGAPAPAVRSAVMLGTVAITEQWQRPVHPWTALALGAVLPTVQPSVVLDLGWQLSVAGMASLVAAGALFRRLRHSDRSTSPMVNRALRWMRSLRGVRWMLFRETATGVIATAVTAPLIAWTFGRVSVVAPLTNIAAGPVVAALQPALFLAMLLSPWPTVAAVVADACAVPLALLDRIATVGSVMPWSVMRVAPTLGSACCLGLASAALVRATATRRWKPAVGIAACALVLAVWLPTRPLGVGALELHVLDVGQGDALALRTPRGRWVIVDAGRRWDGGDAGRRVVVPYVRRLGGSVAAFVLTHAHDDHAGGAASVIEALRPEQWWEPAFVTGSAGYRAALEALRRARIPWHRAKPGDAITIDGVRIEVVAPDSAWTTAQRDANETSVMLRVSLGDVALLLTGDAEVNEERWVTENASTVRAQILKLGHHGSRTSSSAEFLDAVHPLLGLISVGEGNSYGHPSPETLAEFAKRGIPLLRTDHDGTIVVSTDGHSIAVRSRSDEFTLTGR